MEIVGVREKKSIVGGYIEYKIVYLCVYKVGKREDRRTNKGTISW